jgi:hypothetical protein
VAPAQRCTLPSTHASEELDRVDDLTIERDPGVGDQCLGFVVREHGILAPLGILVDQRPELAIVEDARRLLDQLGEPRVAEHGRARRIDVVDALWSKGPLLVCSQLVEQIY